MRIAFYPQEPSRALTLTPTLTPHPHPNPHPNHRCLLEANLSCNFFRASFVKDAYFGFVEETISHLEQREGKKRA